MQPIRVLIADDQPHVVAHMQEHLAGQPWITLVGLVPSFVAAAEWLANDSADVVIFGLVGMGESPFIGISRLQHVAPQTRLVVCSSQVHSAARLLEEGVLGYVLRSDGLQAVVDALHAVMRGEQYCSPEVARFLEETTGPFQITPEQRRILELLGDGVFDSPTIAERLGIAPDAVTHNLISLWNKTHCFGRRELAAWYRRNGSRLTPEGTLLSGTDTSM